MNDPFPALGATGLVAVVFAAAMLFQRSLYASAICLLAALGQIGVAFYLLGFELLAFLQVLIYAGAVMVLLVEAVMAAPPRLASRVASLRIPLPLVALAGLALLGQLLAVGFAEPTGAYAAPGPKPLIAEALFGRWALLTEALGLLILLAAMAVIETGRAHAWGPSEPSMTGRLTLASPNGESAVPRAGEPLRGAKGR